ncbi:YceI family protein [Pedobacter arcticus]|uniref:YceI family protein n=1 Tax=Pedobacter arcticus TaxID=752140 RepID=UPI00036DD64D|nr:YceI family protein [Pedobacter arcticus]
MRYFILPLFLFIGCTLKAQVYNASEMYVHLFSPAPIADIEAVSNAAKAKLNTVKKEVEIEIPVTSFTFKKALMQAHFNEKYIESAKYPNANFHGKYTEEIDLSKDGVYTLHFNGKFNIHGVTKAKSIACTFTVKQQKIIFDTNFKLLTADYKVKAPDVIYRKVGQEVTIDATGVLTKI